MKEIFFENSDASGVVVDDVGDVEEGLVPSDYDESNETRRTSIGGAATPIDDRRIKYDGIHQFPNNADDDDEGLHNTIELTFETESGEVRRRYHQDGEGSTGARKEETKIAEKDLISFDLSHFTGRLTLSVRLVDDFNSQMGVEVVMKAVPAQQKPKRASRVSFQMSKEGTDDLVANKPKDEARWSKEGEIGVTPVPSSGQRTRLVSLDSAYTASPSLPGHVFDVAGSSVGSSQAMLGFPYYEDAEGLMGVSTLFATANAVRRLRTKQSIQRMGTTAAVADRRRESADDIAVTTTSLHQLCASPRATLPELQDALEREPDAASTRDANGCLPLHVLSRNDALVGGSILGREVATKFGWILMRTFPDAITTLDDGRYMPFVQAIEEWVYWVYETHQKQELSEASSSSAQRNRSGGGHKRSHQKTCTILDGSSESLLSYSNEAFPAAQLYNEVEWCFSMLSLAMDGLGGREHGFHEGRKRRLFRGGDKQAREAVVTHLVTKMPTLLKTVFLIEDDGNNTREKLLNMSIFRRILLCRASVGPWLINMITEKGIASQRAVDYMQLVSGTTVDDYVGGFTNVLARDIKAFEEARKRVFDAVADLNGPVTSLLTLDEDEQERAVGASVIWHVMQKRLLRPFVVHMVMIDFILHLVLLLSCRLIFHFRANQIVSKWVVLTVCVHYVIRKLCECASIFVISRKAFLSYMLSMWTFLDHLTIALACVAVLGWDPDYFGIGFYGFLLGMLWVKILSFLKLINRSMATFIIVLLRILRKMKFFALVLVVIILMFGDLFHYVLTAADKGQYCLNTNGTLADPALDFCSDDMSDSYLRVYALLLGDFELNDWRATHAMSILWCIFTVIGIVVMLNLLIAVFSTSYDEACQRSFLIFGRARIAFAAQSYSLEKFLRPQNPCAQVNRRWCLADVAFRILRHAMLISLLGTAMFATAEGYDIWRRHYKTSDEGILRSILLGTMFVLMALSNFVIFVYALEFWLGGCAPESVGWVSKILGRRSARMTEFTAIRLFGLSDVFDGPDGYDGKPHRI